MTTLSKRCRQPGVGMHGTLKRGAWLCTQPRVQASAMASCSAVNLGLIAESGERSVSTRAPPLAASVHPELFRSSLTRSVQKNLH